MAKNLAMYNPISTYVTFTENHSKKYSLSDVVTICKRIKNSKRDFLFVNPLQGKNLHVNPSKSIDLFEELVLQIKTSIPESEKVIVIGFAETATAIGNYIASRMPNCIYYMQTTRENIPNKEPLLTFQEEHSHATKHFLYGDIKKLKSCHHIIFVDDEISTGNTILNFIKALNSIGVNCNYSVGSILNCQNTAWMEKFSKLNINTFCIMKGEINNLKAIVPVKVTNPDEAVCKHKVNPNILKVTFDIPTANIGVVPVDFKDTVNAVYNEVFKSKKITLPKPNEKVLVLGTEEYMFIPMIFGNILENNLKLDVQFHATTRTPIEASSAAGYAIKNRFHITSCYDEERTTFIYNLKKYDRVYIVTNVTPTKGFLIDIYSALEAVGCNSSTISCITLNTLH